MHLSNNVLKLLVILLVVSLCILCVSDKSQDQTESQVQILEGSHVTAYDDARIEDCNKKQEVKLLSSSFFWPVAYPVRIQSQHTPHRLGTTQFRLNNTELRTISRTAVNRLSWIEAKLYLQGSV
jgi:hypothetical protein